LAAISPVPSPISSPVAIPRVIIPTNGAEALKQTPGSFEEKGISIRRLLRTSKIHPVPG
jgi:hypothetical protein